MTCKLQGSIYYCGYNWDITNKGLMNLGITTTFAKTKCAIIKKCERRKWARVQFITEEIVRSSTEVVTSPMMNIPVKAMNVH